MDMLEEEVEILTSIYFDEVVKTLNEQTTYIETLSMVLHPSTADVAELQYVCVKIVMRFSPEYPQKLPEISLHNPRGLSENDLKRLETNLTELAEERRGETMVFELVDMVKEFVTVHNHPSCECAICLEEFREDQTDLLRTECYHYFHCYCLLDYINHCASASHSHEMTPSPWGQQKPRKQDIPCPVCRTTVPYNIQQLESVPKPLPQMEEYQLSREMKILQKQMSELYTRQKMKGGIIDMNAEKNKYYVDETTTVFVAPLEDDPPKKQETDQKNEPQKQTFPTTTRTNSASHRHWQQPQQGRCYDNYTKSYTNRNYNHYHSSKPYITSNRNKTTITTTTTTEQQQTKQTTADSKSRPSDSRSLQSDQVDGANNNQANTPPSQRTVEKPRKSHPGSTVYRSWEREQRNPRHYPPSSQNNTTDRTHNQNSSIGGSEQEGTGYSSRSKTHHYNHRGRRDGNRDSYYRHGNHDSYYRHGNHDNYYRHDNHDSYYRHGNHDSYDRHGNHDSYDRHGNQSLSSSRHHTNPPPPSNKSNGYDEKLLSDMRPQSSKRSFTNTDESKDTQHKLASEET